VLERGAVDPRLQFALKEEKSASARRPAMRDLSEPRSLVDCPNRAAEQASDILDV